MPDYGTKITLPGFDITDTDPSHYQLWSKYKTAKTFIVGTASLGFANEAATETDHNIVLINHGLGYTPLALFYWNLNGSSYSGDYWIGAQGGSHKCYEVIVMHVTSTFFALDYRFDFATGGDKITGISSYNFNFIYYIFIDQAQ